MNKSLVLTFVICIIGVVSHTQTLQCSFPLLKGTLVKFGTFEGLQSKNLDSAFVNEKGEFTFQFSTQKPEVGYLITAENKPYFLILDKGEQIELSGEDLYMPETVKVLSGKQNQAFAQYASEHPKREQTLSAWKYLDNIYTLDPLFAKEKATKKTNENKT